MRVLAFDCSGPRGSVAVLDNEETVFAESFESPRGRGGALFPVLQRAIAEGGRPGRIAVGVGPGSYNGLRTALAAAEGLRLATGAELVGIASVRAFPCEELEYIVIGDARGGVFLHARIRGRSLEGDLELLEAGVLRERLGATSAPIFATSALPAFPEARVMSPSAEVLARLGTVETPGSTLLEPIYLKPAHITKPNAMPGRRMVS